MTDVVDLVPDVRVEIPDIPSFVAERQILRAARELCEEARCFRSNFDISTVADTSTVDLAGSIPNGTELVDVISLKPADGSGPVLPTTWKHLDENSTNWRTETAAVASHYVISANNVIRLYPIPTTTESAAYHIRVAVKPLLTATAIGALIVNKYDEVLTRGALARLYAMPNKTWTNFDLAAYHANYFNEGVLAARTEAADEYQTGVPRKVKYGGL